MKNAHSIADTITVPAPSGGAVTGVPFILGTVLAIPVTTAAQGVPVAVQIEHAFVLPKLSSAVITAGAKVHWDVSAGEVIVASTATGDLENFGIAIEEAGNGTTTVAVKLIPGLGTVKSAG